MLVLRLLTLVFMVFISGCEDETSSTESASSLTTVTMRVTSSSNENTRVKVNLYTNDYVDGFLPVEESVRLEEGDELTVTANSITKKLTKNNSQSNLAYTAELELGASLTEYAIHYNRPSRSEVLESRVTSPPSLSINTPIENDTFSLNDTFDISWFPVVENSQVCLCVSTGCFDDELASNEKCDCTVADDGAHTVQMTELFQDSRYSLISALSCSVDIALSRTSSGTISEVFRGGDIMSTQVRSVKVNFTM